MTFQGPFPTVDAKSILQEQSIRALQAALPISDYLFRRESCDDYGVDGSIELRAAGSAVNVQAQVQLKGRSNTHVNKEGAVAVPIETININYLLNGICPLYILFRPESNELRFAFAREEWARLQRENPLWRGQETNTLYFRRVLTPESLRDLRQAIIAEASVRRSVDERLKGLSAAVGHSVHIDAHSLEVTDSEQICSTLARSGLALAASGSARAVIERSRLVGTNTLLRAPRAALAVAYAHFQLSLYHDASAAIRQLLLSRPSLEPDDRSLLDVLYISVRRMLGESDKQQYDRQIETWRSGASPHLGVQFDISQAWAEYSAALAAPDDTRGHAAARAQVRRELARGRDIAGQLLLDQIQLLELTIAAHEVSDSDLHAAALRDVVDHGSGDSHVAREATRRAHDTRQAWHSSLESLIRRTRNTDTRVCCEAYVLLVHARLEEERRRRYVACSRGDRPVALEAASAVVSAARETLTLARSLDNKDVELTCMLALAESLDTCGQPEEATTLAVQVREIAELTGSALHVRHANHFLEGGDRFENRLRLIEELASDCEEDLLRRAPEEQLHFMASLMAAANELPESRIPNILHSLRCRRQMAQERDDWCRHIVLAQFQPHFESPLTMHVSLPVLKVQCMKLGRETSVRARQVEHISREFRQAHCLLCIDRAPAAGAPSNLASPSEPLDARRLRNQKKKARQNWKRGARN